MKLRRTKAVPIAVETLLQPDDRFVALAEGQLRYRQVGSGPAVVLIHGFASSLFTWRRLTPLLAPDHSVYALDLLGFGLSDKPTRADLSLEGHGRRVVQLLEALDLWEVTLVGHSMGGVVASYAALADGQRIKRVALLDANFYQRNGPPLPMFPPLPQLLARRFYSPAGRAASLRRCYADPTNLTPEVLEVYLAPTRTLGALDSLAAFLATPGPATYAALPPRLNLPTLVLWGQQDRLWPLADGLRLARDIPGARFQAIAGAGHMVQEEQPEAVAVAVRHFVESRCK